MERGRLGRGRRGWEGAGRAEVGRVERVRAGEVGEGRGENGRRDESARWDPRPIRATARPRPPSGGAGRSAGACCWSVVASPSPTTGPVTRWARHCPRRGRGGQLTGRPPRRRYRVSVHARPVSLVRQRLAMALLGRSRHDPRGGPGGRVPVGASSATRTHPAAGTTGRASWPLLGRAAELTRLGGRPCPPRPTADHSPWSAWCGASACKSDGALPSGERAARSARLRRQARRTLPGGRVSWLAHTHHGEQRRLLRTLPWSLGTSRSTMSATRAGRLGLLRRSGTPGS